MLSSSLTQLMSQLQGCSQPRPISHADPTQQAPGSSGLGLGPVSAQLGATRQGRGTQAAWRVDRQGHRRQIPRPCGQSVWPSRAWPLAVSVQWLLGLRKGQVLLGYLASTSCSRRCNIVRRRAWNLEGDTAERIHWYQRGQGARSTAEEPRGAGPGDPRLPTGCLVTTISPLPRGAKREPGPPSCEATGFEEQLNRAADPVELYRRMLLVFQRVSGTDRGVLD